MRVIGVIDLWAGRAVHARGGVRAGYQPVRDVAGIPVDADPLALARAYVGLGIDEIYVADLDAITSGTAQDRTISALTAIAPLWVDAGISSAATAERALADGVIRVIVGLETLTSFDALRQICDAVGSDRVAFSLDLRSGEPIAPWAAGESPAILAGAAVDAGATAVIVLDLARVGAGTGLDLDVMTAVRRTTPTATLIAGGGVRGPDDLAWLASAGYDGALVASAVHDGRLPPPAIAAARRLQPYISR